MATPRRWKNEAERKKAYRERKKREASADPTFFEGPAETQAFGRWSRKRVTGRFA